MIISTKKKTKKQLKGKTKIFPFEITHKMEVPTITTFIICCTGYFNQCNKANKINKCVTVRKKSLKH